MDSIIHHCHAGAERTDESAQLIHDDECRIDGSEATGRYAFAYDGEAQRIETENDAAPMRNAVT